MIDFLTRALRGITGNPKLTAFLRAAVEVALLAGLSYAENNYTDLGIPTMYYGAVFGVLRYLEGVIDSIDPTKARRKDALEQAKQGPVEIIASQKGDILMASPVTQAPSERTIAAGPVLSSVQPPFTGEDFQKYIDEQGGAGR